MDNRKKASLILVILLLMVSVVYAALSSTLNINGTSKIAATSWDIHFENAQATSNSNVTPTIAPSALPENKSLLLTYDVQLANPGDVYEFSVDVVNGGTIDGMIELFTSTIKVGDGPEEVVSSSTIPSYLSYSVKYSDNSNIQVNRSLNASTSRTIIVHVELKDDITAEELAELDGTTISLKLGMSYKQKDSTAID